MKGVEPEAAGRITERWTINGGFTALKMDGPTDAAIRTYIPRRTLKAATTYTVPELHNLQVGAAVRWQSHTSIEDVGVIDQDAYAVFDLTASVNVTDKVRELNLRNVGDKKYYTTLNQNQAFYAEPRNVSARLDYAFWSSRIRVWAGVAADLVGGGCSPGGRRRQGWRLQAGDLLPLAGKSPRGFHRVSPPDSPARDARTRGRLAAAVAYVDRERGRTPSW